MAAVIADPTRDDIFSLRAQGVSIRKIATQLGISTGKVQRELAKPAPTTGDGGGLGGGNGAVAGGYDPSASAVATFGADPAFLERRRALELRRMSLQESELGIRELEARRRIEALEAAASRGSADGQTFAGLVLAELRDLRSRVDARQLDPRAGAGGPQSVVDVMTQAQDVVKIASTFAPPRSVSAADLDYTLAHERIQSESQRILAKQQAELEIERAKVEGESARNHAMAKVIEDVGPAFLTAAAKWFESQSRGVGGGGVAPASLPTTPVAGGGPAAPMLGGGPAAPAQAAAVKGWCPRCGAGELEIVPTGTDEDACPACGLILAVVGGEIVSGDRSFVAPPVQTFAS